MPSDNFIVKKSGTQAGRSVLPVPPRTTAMGLNKNAYNLNLGVSPATHGPIQLLQARGEGCGMTRVTHTSIIGTVWVIPGMPQLHYKLPWGSFVFLLCSSVVALR